jgi:rod shape-determining protein MreC
MNQLLELFIRYRNLLAFLALELCCMWIIQREHAYNRHKISLFLGGLSGSVMALQQEITGYWKLRQVNEKLQDENVKWLSRYAQVSQHIPIDSLALKQLQDSSRQAYRFLPTLVIGHSIRKADNHITINAGSRDGVREGMGLVLPHGALGIVKATTPNYAVATSLLHSATRTAARFQRTGDICTLKWPGGNSRELEALYVERHVNVQVGDTLITHDNSLVYPPNLPLGRVIEVDTDETKNYIGVKVRLFVNFSTLSHAYVVFRPYSEELDSLAQYTTTPPQ